MSTPEPLTNFLVASTIQRDENIGLGSHSFINTVWNIIIHFVCEIFNTEIYECEY